MILNMSGGGSSGASLNFKVVGGTVAPSNPTENTIWINTNTTITSWEFSATQPNAATGKVWIGISKSSPVAFNALKKNGVMVYPSHVKQYVSGAWVDKDVKTYQNGEWVDWVVYLCEGADKNTALTGGWTLYFGEPTGFGGDFNDSGISIYSNGYGDYQYGWAYTNKKIDVTNYSRLVADVNVLRLNRTDGWISLCLATTAKFNNEADAVAQKKITTTDSEFAVDVSELSGSYYVGLCAVFADTNVDNFRLM